ncbi:MAG TPA: replication-associated recombination protein A [Candidatus Dormibacteraeota bacterium]|nr:replication-associated recombination protein A [Candidatus Dormibacteraeota bacterium]
MAEQSSLFGAAPGSATESPEAAVQAPLATRMRPRTFDEFVGQHRAIGAGTVLRRAVDAGEAPSLILWGPPGSGKTTLAALIAGATNASFEAVSATSAGVADLRKVVERARERLRTGRRTILFIDEIHRFNKGQQDAVLPHVENATVTLLGATTENPSFEVNAALLSRSRVIRLEAIEPDDLRSLIQRALTDTERGLGAQQVAVDQEAIDRLVTLSGGDARIALNSLELAVQAAVPDPAGAVRVTVADVEGALQNPALLYDRAGDQHYWLISAFIKSVRGSDPDAAVYWLARMLEAGEDPLFVARRMVILAAEDVGLADPQALAVTVAAQQAAHFIGMPEGFLPLTEAALYLAAAPKSNSVLRAYVAASGDVAETLHQPVPLHLRNAVTGLGRAMGYGSGYRYAHDHEGGVVKQEHLPASLSGRQYYDPSDHGAEGDVAERLEANRQALSRRAPGS